MEGTEGDGGGTGETHGSGRPVRTTTYGWHVPVKPLHSTLHQLFEELAGQEIGAADIPHGESLSIQALLSLAMLCPTRLQKNIYIWKDAKKKSPTDSNCVRACDLGPSRSKNLTEVLDLVLPSHPSQPTSMVVRTSLEKDFLAARPIGVPAPNQGVFFMPGSIVNASKDHTRAADAGSSLSWRDGHFRQPLVAGPLCEELLHTLSQHANCSKRAALHSICSQLIS
jgi:hypothetical protein